jgi:hypothetical protein
VTVAAGLVRKIGDAGGSLAALPDGRLKFSAVPSDFYAELKARKSEVIALLLERTASPAASTFRYRPRTAIEIDLRAKQSEESPVVRLREITKARPREASAAIVTKKSICSRCGHEKQYHCDSPQSHIPSSDAVGTGWYSCILSHCEYGIAWDEDGLHLCSCFAFEFNGKITPWCPPVTPETLCTRCGHPRESHCHKSKTLTGVTINGKPFLCKHYPSPCASTACAEAVSPENRTFCGCRRFASPYARKGKTRKAATAEMQLALHSTIDSDRGEAAKRGRRIPWA